MRTVLERLRTRHRRARRTQSAAIDPPPHLDGNTRLCTATSDAALKESFGSDGDPGSITDFDLCDTLFLVGHNMARNSTRRAGLGSG